MIISTTSFILTKDGTKRSSIFVKNFKLLALLSLLIFVFSCQKYDLERINPLDPKSKIFTPYTTITDIDGNVYNTVIIGTQIWMAENLKTTKFQNGDLIGTTIPSTLDISSESTPKYQWAYGGNESNVATYGRLYTWYTITDSRNVCPVNWHVPSDVEWHSLIQYIDTNADPFNSDESLTAGGILKETGFTHWNSPNTGATNSFGFTALPGGLRGYFGTFIDLRNSGNWYSSSELDATTPWIRSITYNYNKMLKWGYSKSYGYSVRCLKN